ncbi:hypothetical protein LX36DRAFT_344557 [Colletotrichum falcatum]|nr:hypothetical protein LX36DRAFT_344557 [Colletotrichum falcatum]
MASTSVHSKRPASTTINRHHGVSSAQLSSARRPSSTICIGFMSQCQEPSVAATFSHVPGSSSLALTAPASSNLESIRAIGCFLPCLPYRSPGTQARPHTCCGPPKHVSSQLSASDAAVGGISGAALPNLAKVPRFTYERFGPGVAQDGEGTTRATSPTSPPAPAGMWPAVLHDAALIRCRALQRAGHITVNCQSATEPCIGPSSAFFEAFHPVP